MIAPVLYTQLWTTQACLLLGKWVIQERLQKLGIGRRTVTTAKIELGVETYKNGNVWFWHLDDED